MADLYLMLRHVRLEPTVARRCSDASFASQKLPLAALDAFLDDSSWGRAAGAATSGSRM